MINADMAVTLDGTHLCTVSADLLICYFELQNSIGSSGLPRLFPPIKQA